MYEEVPDWLRPFLKQDAYNPNQKFLEDLDPQSRVEAILKFGFLALISGSSTDDGFFLVEGNYFVDSNSNFFKVPSH